METSIGNQYWKPVLGIINLNMIYEYSSKYTTHENSQVYYVTVLRHSVYTVLRHSTTSQYFIDFYLVYWYQLAPRIPGKESQGIIWTKLSCKYTTPQVYYTASILRHSNIRQVTETAKYKEYYTSILRHCYKLGLLN